MSIVHASLRALGTGAAPGGNRGKLLVLTYHQVHSRSQPGYPEIIDRQKFDNQMSVLREYFTPLVLCEAIEKLRSGTLPPCAVSVTFDDGYADNCEVALPILQKWDIPATFFIATGFLDGGRMWNDTVLEVVSKSSESALKLGELGFGHLSLSTSDERMHAAKEIIRTYKHLSFDERMLKVNELESRADVELTSSLMMSSSQVRTLHLAGMEIGAHTVNHPILAKVPLAKAKDEIESGKKYLEDLLKTDVYGFAYPNGNPGVDYVNDHVELVRQMGFSYAVSTARGYASKNTDMFQVPRHGLWDQNKFKLWLRVIGEYARTQRVECA